MKNRCRLPIISTKSKHPCITQGIRGVMVLILFIVTALIGTGNNAAAQQLTVTGTVLDQNKQPLAGVTVLIKGTTSGTLTDMSGKYVLTNVQSNSTVTFSFVGMTTQEIQLNGKSVIDVTLTEAAVGLNEVVVVGYGTQTKKTLTGAVSSINSEAIIKTKTSTVSGALVGKIPGITARLTDGRPGGMTALQIRNFGTPLYIIDGVPRTEVDFNTIGMENIESVSILKDASASIYGLLASNGVVIVTTKLGKQSEKPVIKLDGYVGWQDFTRFPHPPNAYNYMLGRAESDQNKGIAPTVTQAALDSWKAGTYDPANGIDFRSFDYYKEIVGKNFPLPQNNLNVSASGATERVSYFFSVGELFQQGPIPDHKYHRYNIQSNLEARLTKGLKIGTQINAREEWRHTAGLPGWDDYANVFLGIIRNWPTERPFANDNPNFLNNTHSININPGTFLEKITGPADIYSRVFRGNIYAEYDFGIGLKAKGTFAYGYQFDHDEFFEYTYNAFSYDRLTNAYNIVPGGGNQNPFRATQRTQLEDKFLQFQLNYNKKFGDHSISAVAAYEASYNTYIYFYFHTIPPNNYILPMYFENADADTQNFNYSSRASYIGRFNYNYKEKYLVELLGRYDGSYLYAPGKRWGLFPGISLGWRISNEAFFEPFKDIVSDLKFRASYGLSGSEQGVNPFGYIDGFDWAQSNYIFSGTTFTGVRPRGLPVTNLSWVTAANTNVGFDFSLFGSKINGQFDLFERRVSGIPAARYDVLLPSEVGYALPNENLNVTANRGIEGMISYSGKAGQVSYTIGVNSTLSRMRNISTYKPRFGNSWDEYRNSIEDRWSNINWGYRILGQFQTQEQIDNYAVNVDGSGNRTLLPGDLIYEDVNGDKIIDALDMRPIGYAVGANSYNTIYGYQTVNQNSLPYMSYGLTGSADYKGFNLVLDFAGATMQSFIRNTDIKIPFNSDGAGPSWLIEDRWHHADPFDVTSPWIAGANPPTRGNITNHSNFSRTNDFYLINISYLRLRDLEFGYTLSSRFLQNLKISSLRVYTNITALFSIDNMKKYDLDPEVTNASGMVMPQTRVYNFGFTLTL
jgi:TonB-linked SusC/RagA family outer membrane protein